MAAAACLTWWLPSADSDNAAGRPRGSSSSSSSARVPCGLFRHGAYCSRLISTRAVHGGSDCKVHGGSERHYRRVAAASHSGASRSVDEGNCASHDGPRSVSARSQKRRVLIFVSLAMALCNADRVIMSVEIVHLSLRYNWSTAFAGYVQSSFLWGYMISSIIGGALVDRYGGKIVLACGVFLWSLATLLTAWAVQHSTLMLFSVRVLLGLGEGVAMPCMNNLVSRQASLHIL